MQEPQAKGSVLIDVVRSLRKIGEPAAAKVPSELRGYLDQRVLPFQWYPESALHQLMAVLAEFLPGSQPQALEEMGRTLAKSQLRELYSNMVTEGDPPRTMRRAVTALWATQHDTGRLVIRDSGPGWLETELTEYDSSSGVWCPALGGYMLGTIEVAGGEDPRVRKLQCRSEGSDRCGWRLSWKAP